jgi:hypothetical protein
VVTPAQSQCLRWSEVPIICDCHDYHNHVPSPGRFPLVASPIVGRVRLTRVLMDGGSGINILCTDTMAGPHGDFKGGLCSSEAPFYGIILGI